MLKFQGSGQVKLGGDPLGWEGLWAGLPPAGVLGRKDAVILVGFRRFLYTPAAVVAYRYRGRGERCSAGHRRFKKKGKTMYYTGTSQYYSRPLLSIDQPSFFVDGRTDGRMD